ncbi:MAG: hypothetical protein AB7E55_04060 [Pigmentiphaga sp.]
MTSPNRSLSLEDVLDALFLHDDAPTSEMIVQACQAHPEYREDILEYSALWMAQEALPEPAEAELDVSDAAVMRLQSRVLNLLHATPPALDNSDAVQNALKSLTGHRLRTAAQAIGVGDTKLLYKILTRAIINTPHAVVQRLARFLDLSATSLREALGPELALHRSYKATDRPTVAKQETWDQAIEALTVDETEKARLRAMQDSEDSP